MQYKLFIDDERFPVTDDWLIARSSATAIEMVEFHGMPVFISFDHDLSVKDTAIEFINWLTDALIDGRVAFPADFEFAVHSQNPVVAENIRSKMDQLLRHFKP